MRKTTQIISTSLSLTIQNNKTSYNRYGYAATYDTFDNKDGCCIPFSQYHSINDYAVISQRSIACYAAMYMREAGLVADSNENYSHSIRGRPFR